MNRLSDEEILSLKTFLVKDNPQVTGIKILRGYRGIGGSNRSGFQTTEIEEYPLGQLSDGATIRVVGSEICALVNDVLYFRCNADGKMTVYTQDLTDASRSYCGESIAYDTVSAARVILLTEE